MLDFKQMLDAGIHFGHKTSRWSPKMRPYIWGSRNRVHLIDVSKTAFLLERAGNFVHDLAAEGKSFLFVGTKKPAQALTQKIATSLGMPFVVHRWIGGTLSNFEQVKKAITRLLHLQDILAKNDQHYKKKELVMIQKEIERLEKNVGGIINLDYPPAAVIVVDGKKEHAAVKEASRLGIPVIGLIDTNTDPEGVSIVIPGNDDSPKAIAFVLDYLEKAIADGAKKFSEQKAAALQAKRAESKAQAAPVKASAPAQTGDEAEGKKTSAA